MPPRKSSDRFCVRIESDNINGLKDRDMISQKSDGRFDGISHAVNKSIREYLRRVVISIAAMAVFGTHSIAALFATAAAFGLSYFTVACRSIAAVAAKGETQ